jgi:hypothetical protein
MRHAATRSPRFLNAEKEIGIVETVSAWKRASGVIPGA